MNIKYFILGAIAASLFSASASRGVETVCVKGFLFVTKGDSITQMFYGDGSRHGSLQGVRCGYSTMDEDE